MIEFHSKTGWESLNGVTFDVDATLYNYPLMMIRRLHRWGWYVPLLAKLTEARKRLRREGRQVDLRKRQAEIVAELAGWDVEKARERLDRVLYNGWNVDFKGIRPYRGVVPFIRRLKRNGIKIGVISDYPPKRKMELMGLMELGWDVIVESEELGVLKPDTTPFTEALKGMGLEDKPETVLHIGDSYNYDVVGAKRAGMKAAWLRRAWRFSRLPWGEEFTVDGIDPDIVFNSWKELDSALAEICGWE